jgi:hypothetical protein
LEEEPVAKISTVALRGESSDDYVFDVWPMNQAFKVIGVVYAVTRRYQNAAGGYSHDVIYIGQTEDLPTRFGDHHKDACFAERNANCICTLVDGDEDSRFAKEADLVRHYNPHCND